MNGDDNRGRKRAQDMSQYISGPLYVFSFSYCNFLYIPGMNGVDRGSRGGGGK